MKKTPIPRLPKFYPRKEPLKASELNRLVDAINALATRIEEPEVKRKKQQEFLMPFYPRYRYDPETGNGFVSVTSGYVIAPSFQENSSNHFFLQVTNTWQPPDEPLEMQISEGQQVSLIYDVENNTNLLTNARIEITNENESGNATSTVVKLAVLKERDDKPNGASAEEWCGFDYYAAGSHYYWHTSFLTEFFPAGICSNGSPTEVQLVRGIRM